MITFLEFVRVWLNFKVIKCDYNFFTKTSDSIKNYVYNEKNQPCQEVGDGYIFVKKYNSWTELGIKITDIAEKIALQLT